MDRDTPARASLTAHNIALVLGKIAGSLAAIDAETTDRDFIAAPADMAQGDALRLSEALGMPGARGEGLNEVRLPVS